MKVFKVFDCSSYSGGVMLIAANNGIEAQNIVDHYAVDNYSFYGYTTPSEVEGMSFDTEEPKIIMNHIYQE